jgi:peroxiredoxin family protein
VFDAIEPGGEVGKMSPQQDGAGTANAPKSMTIIVTKGSLDWAYPPFILGTTAAAMGVDVTMFFTFYGLPLLLKKLDLQISALGNPAMKMPVMGMHMAMPNIVGMIPGVDAAATVMLKNLIAKKGVASIEELRDMARFEYKVEDMIGGIKLGGAATYMENALKSDINLYI